MSMWLPNSNFQVIKNDANINVASVAVKCIANLATGLRRAFQPYTTSLTPIILEKFKEKKPVLKDPLVECIDAIYMTTVCRLLLGVDKKIFSTSRT